jgi:hypothetical protein
MKTFKSTTLLAFAAIAMLASFAPTANAALMTYFNFNDAGTNGSAAAAAAYTSDTAVPPPAQSTTLVTNYTLANILSAQGSSINVAPGDPITSASNAGNHALSFTNANGNEGKYFEFDITTLAFKDFILKMAVRGTGTSFTTLTLSYSTDGTNFTNDGTFTSARDSNYALATFDLSAISAIENQVSPVTIRITFSGATGNGNTNIDNITLTADPVPEPATVLGGLLGVAGLCFHQRRRLLGMLKLA